MNYTIQNGQNIFDVAINTIEDLNGIYSLIQDNGIASIEAAPVGLSVSYTPPPVTPPTTVSISYSEPASSSTFSTVQGQSVFDIALQVYGDLNQTYKLIQDSNFDNLLTYPFPLTFFIFNPLMVSDQIFSKYLSANGITMATVNPSGTTPSGGLLTDSGIQIETDSGVNILVD